MNKPQMTLRWNDGEEQAISRAKAAREIRKNRNAHPALGVRVFRKFRETYIVSEFLGGSQTPDRFCCYGGRITTVKPEKPPPLRRTLKSRPSSLPRWGVLLSSSRVALDRDGAPLRVAIAGRPPATRAGALDPARAPWRPRSMPTTGGAFAPRWSASGGGRRSPAPGYGGRGRLRGPEVYRPGPLPSHPPVHWTVGQGTTPAGQAPGGDRRSGLALQERGSAGRVAQFASPIYICRPLGQSIVKR
ncbi:hypothetical protein ACKVWM_011630 [Pyricularia oryzae]